MLSRLSRWALSCSTFVPLAMLVVLLPAQAIAQVPDTFFVPGRNVNTVGPIPPGPNPFLIGNPGYKQRNEASCDVSPNNWLVVLCGNNDYRGISLFGDSWIGLTMSTDGGLTWRSRLMDGFPTSNVGIGAADPVVRVVPGLALVTFITINRSNGRGTLSVARLTELNKENGEPYQYLDKVVVGSGTPGQFNDKPSELVSLNPAGGTMIVGGQKVPNGTIHVAYSLFTGTANNPASQIYYLNSSDYGQTWTKETKLSESVGTNQGTDLAVNGNTVVAAWRRVGDTNEPDSIMFATSTDGGKTFGKPTAMWTGRFFDQDTTNLQIRTESMPAIAHDGQAFQVFWSARGFISAFPDDARIVVATSIDGTTWSAPKLVDATSHRGHQLMPVAAVAGGRIQVNWIDTRNNEDWTFGPTITDIITSQCPANLTTPTMGTSTDCVYRVSADVFAAQAPASSAPPSSGWFGSSRSISRYRTAMVSPGNGAPPTLQQIEHNFIDARLFMKGSVPFHGDYHAVASQRYLPDPANAGSWIRNTATSTSKAVFYSAFTDNREIRGYVWAGPTNTTYTPQSTMEGLTGDELATVCSIDPTAPQTTPDLTVTTQTDAARSRFQNIYAAPSFPGLIVASPSGSKPTGTLERSYVIFVRNMTASNRTYRLTIANQPPDSPPSGTGRAAWRPDNPNVPATSCDDPAACTSLSTTITRGSSITRTVYVRSTTARPRILVNVCETSAGVCSSTGQTGYIVLNANPDVPEIQNPDGLPAGLDLLTEELFQPDIITRQSTLYFTSLVNSDVTPVTNVAAPRIEYPRIEYPRVEYPRIEYPRIEYPRIEYPRIEYPRIEYSAIQNPRIEYSALSGDDTGVTAAPVAVTEITWPVTTDSLQANTTTAMTARLFVNGPLTDLVGAQIIVSVPNFSTVLRSCLGTPETVVENQVVFNTVLTAADVANLASALATEPDTVNPSTIQPSFFVKYNQVVYLTLRLFGKADLTLAGRAGVIVKSQPDTTTGDALNQTMDGTIDATPPTFPASQSIVFTPALPAEATSPSGASVSYSTPVASDDGGGAVTVTCTPSSGSTFAIGTSPVNCVATDLAGNSTAPTHIFDVTVADKTPPAFSGVPSNQILEATGPSGATAVFGTPTATDIVSGAVAVTCDHASGSTYPIGITTVTCSATDGAGNTGSASFTITVRDSTAPVIAAHADITAEATSAAGAIVAYTAPATTDVVDGAGTASCSPVSGSVFPLGSTTVTCTKTDSHGNAATPTTFLVRVVDTTPPVIAAHADVTVNSNGFSTAVVTYTLPLATDAVGVVSLVCSPASGTSFAIGTTAIVCVAKDAANNTATSGFNVIVVLKYGFIGLGAPTSANQGSSVPLVWTYTLNGVAVDTRLLIPVVRVRTLTSCTPSGTETGSFYENTQYPGNSNFQYSTTTFAWQFNWQTKPFAKGCYNIYIRLLSSASVFIQDNGPFKIQLK